MVALLATVLPTDLSTESVENTSNIFFDVPAEQFKHASASQCRNTFGRVIILIKLITYFKSLLAS